MTSPTDGRTYSGTITVSVNATDNVGVTRVDFYRDFVVIGSDTTAPYSMTVQTTTADNGATGFGARAYDAAGNEAFADPVHITVKNTTTQPPPTGDQIAPSQPGNLKVTSATATSVAIAWSAATDNVGVTGYGVYRGSSSHEYHTADHREPHRPYVRNRVPGRRRRLDAAGNSSPPANMAVTTSPCRGHPAAEPPTNVTASTRTTTTIGLTWAPVTDNIGVVGYRSTAVACSSTRPRAPPASSAASPAARTTRSLSTRTTEQATTPPEPP